MSVAWTFVTVLVIFAILIGAGNPASLAFRKAMAGTLTDQDIARLPLSQHAKEAHRGQTITAPIIQELLMKGWCSPKRVYLGCKDEKVLFACKVSPQNSSWAMVVIGKRGWKPVIVTAYAVAPQRLDATAVKAGCKLPGLLLP
jgi:hypothetical protein